MKWFFLAFSLWSVSGWADDHVSHFHIGTLGFIPVQIEPKTINGKPCFYKPPSTSIVCTDEMVQTPTQGREEFSAFLQDPEKKLEEWGAWGKNQITALVLEGDSYLKEPQPWVYWTQGQALPGGDRKIFLRIPKGYRVSSLKNWAAVQGKAIWAGVLGNDLLHLNLTAPATFDTCSGLAKYVPNVLTFEKGGVQVMPSQLSRKPPPIFLPDWGTEFIPDSAPSPAPLALRENEQPLQLTEKNPGSGAYAHIQKLKERHKRSTKSLVQKSEKLNWLLEARASSGQPETTEWKKKYSRALADDINNRTDLQELEREIKESLEMDFNEGRNLSGEAFQKFLEN